MLKSMTGFGRAERQNGAFSCKAEIRSVNNRFIDVSTRLPKFLSRIELPLKNLVKKRCARGSFDVQIVLEKSSETSADQEIKPNLALASQYHAAFKEIQDRLGLAGEIDLNTLFSIRDIVKVESVEINEDQEELVLGVVGEALDSLIQMRSEEGQNLENDLANHIAALETWGETIKKRQSVVLEGYREKLNERIKVLTEGIALDESRLAQETAVMADRCDISEELIRLDSHLQQFQNLIQSEEPIGRKLEFLTQEINRETNTIGSKCIDYEISQAVIEMKSRLEKIREQLANVE